MQKILLRGCVALALIACGRSTHSDEGADHYDTRGVVRGFSPDRSMIEIQHENIPGFMPSMTIPFVPRDPKQIADLKTGEAISFRMAVTKKNLWIENVKTIHREKVDVAEPKQTLSVSSDRGARLKEGDQMPAFSLTNQNGEQVSLDTFRGQPFVLTFVFTRCPVPNFCPRMSNNFEDVQAAIKAGSGTLATTRLLSVTLDPGYDTPKILSDYAAFHHTDSKILDFRNRRRKRDRFIDPRVLRYRQNEGGHDFTWTCDRADQQRWQDREDLAGQRLDASGSYRNHPGRN